MAATYTWDVFTSLDGFGSRHGDWGGYWGKQGPELLARRLELYEQPLRMVFGAKTFRENVHMLSSAELDPWVSQMRDMPATVISSTLAEPLGWPDEMLSLSLPASKPRPRCRCGLTVACHSIVL